MINIKTLFKRTLWTGIILCLSIASAFAQQSDAMPKGQFLDAYTKPRSYVKVTDVYSADASRLSTEWAGNGFSLQTVNGNTLYTTGQYAANAQLSTTSPSITLPAVSNNEKLILQLNQSYEVESKYDFISVRVNVNGSATGNEVYRKDGKTSLIEDYINLTEYAGKQVQLSFHLTSDASVQGNGWQIANMELYKAVKNSTAASSSSANTAKGVKSTSPLRAGAASGNTLDILNINTEAFPDAIFIEFTVKDAGGNFVSGLTLSDFTMLDDYGQRYGCLKMLETSGTMQEAVDIVFLVDNSGSMSDDILKVQNAITSFLPALSGKCDARVGLMRFGQDYSMTPVACPDYAVKQEYNNKFWYSLPSETADFLTDIWSANESDGYYEPYYEVLNWVANQNLIYRPNAKKVFIMIGDEKVNDGINNYQCDHSTLSTLTAAGVTSALNQAGIQAFFICDIPYSNGEFSLIASSTGGLIEDIYTLYYNDILDEFGQAIVNKYIMRYCLDVDPTTVDPTVPHTVTVTYNSDLNATDTEIYYPVALPSIVRSLATQNLDNVSQVENVAVNIEVTVIQNGHTLDYIDFYYRQYSEGSYHVERKYLLDGTINGRDVDFTFTIPAGTVQDPMVYYYFEASTFIVLPSGTQYNTVSSPPNNQNYFAWTFAVLPNVAPTITNVAISEVKPCNPITICAEVTDSTQYLIANPTLNYRVNKTPSLYIPIEMLPDAPNSDTYCATIPADAVRETNLEWYIVAEDNYNTLGWHGTPANPKFINTTYQANPSLGGHPIDIVVTNYRNVAMNCDPMEDTDQLAAYFINDCGDEQLAGIGTWDGVNQGFTLTVYGDSDPNDGYKDGFYNGEPIIFKLIRNGVDYNLTNSSLTFSSSAYYLMMSTAVGAGAPAVTIKGNSVDIPHNSTSPSPTNNTDFGITASSNPITKQFSIQNTGCDVLEVKRIDISDIANFTLNPLPNNSFVDPGDYYNFSINYLGLANATATVSVHTNAPSQNPYKFDIKGVSGNSVNLCNGIIIAPNPVYNTMNANLIIPVVNNNTFVLAGLYTLGGTMLQQIWYEPAATIGTYLKTINTSGLTPGNYEVVIIIDNALCSQGIIVQ